MMENIQTNKCPTKITKDIVHSIAHLKNCDAKIYMQKNIFKTNKGCAMDNVIII